MKLLLPALLFLFLAISGSAQSSKNFWTDQPQYRAELAGQPNNGVIYKKFRTLALDLDALLNHLRLAPMELTKQAISSALHISMPLPDGSSEVFEIWESPVMEPELAARYPMIKTFSGFSIRNPAMTIRFGYTLHGFHAIMHGAGKIALVMPFGEGDVYHYRSYWQNDLSPVDSEIRQMSCGFQQSNPEILSQDFAEMHEITQNQRSLNTRDLHTYRLAIATTVEYGLANGGTLASVLSAVTIVVNKANSFFEKEHAVRLVLIANTTQTFYFGSANSDPFTNGDSGKMLNENASVLNNAYSSSGYDVGHVFGTVPSGGIVGTAVLASVCGTNKAKGASNVFTPALFYTVVVHELGHQFNATHTFNFCDGKNEEPTTGYQPGGGSTFMDYTGTGTCGSNSLQNNPDDYFHINSLERVRSFTRNAATGQSCAQIVPVGNAAPITNIPVSGGFYIPIGTPFQLSGKASDPENGPMTYVWEQYDLGPKSALGSPVGTAPLFRSFPPSADTMRMFPRWESLAFNNFSPSEVLPTESRVMTFRFTARDNHPIAGAYAFSEILFNATAAAGPFEVTYPNAAGLILEVGQNIDITWKVANSDLPPVNCKKVNIKMSIDGGATFPITLVQNTDNDGSATVTLPNIPTSQGRIRVEAADNIFFDISNADFWISKPTTPGFLLSAKPSSNPVCLPQDLTVDIDTESLNGFKFAVTLTVEGLPEGAKSSFSFNPVIPGNPTVLHVDLSAVKSYGNYTLKIKGTAPEAANIEITLDLAFISSDFSSLAVISPADGATAQNTLPAFQWKKLDNALTYDIEIATKPTFGAAVISSAVNLSANQFSPGLSLIENTPYYWRVKATNACQKGNFTDAASFHTVMQSCTTVSSTHAPINISGVGLPRIVSNINITQGNTLSDLNVKNVKGTHTAVAHMELRLVSPQGDSVRLMPAQLCSGNQFNLGFDDQSTLTSIPCPPNTGLVYKPDQALSTFNGRNSSGDWSLITAVVHNDGEGGSFTGWSLEYCGAASPKNPYLVKNDTLAVPPNETRVIYTNKLNLAHDDNGPEQLTLTVVTNTTQGFLTNNGVKIGVGDSFTLADILAIRIHYTNTNVMALTDYFTFIVTDGKGGFLGTPRFNFVMDPNAPPSNAIDQQDETDILIYPNPAHSKINVEFQKPLNQNTALAIFNTQGQLVKAERLEAGSQKFILDIALIPAGIYWVQMILPSGIQTKKLMIVR